MQDQSRDRAPRFTLQMPFRYRRVGAAEWNTGTTVNISRSGLLFCAELLPAQGTVLEMEVQLKGQNPDLAAIVCSGTVVRHVDAWRAATRFMEYQLVARRARSH